MESNIFFIYKIKRWDYDTIKINWRTLEYASRNWIGIEDASRLSWESYKWDWHLERSD